jgi:hypothetical protein
MPPTLLATAGEVMKAPAKLARSAGWQFDIRSWEGTHSL